MKPELKKRLIAGASLVAAVVLIVEFNKFMKRQCPACVDGSCEIPSNHGLVINPFPAELEQATPQPAEAVPAAETNLPSETPAPNPAQD